MNNDLKKILQKLEGKGNNGGINITFDEKGISGVRGNDGYTPVKGIDYFTDKEIRQIIEIVKEMSTPVKGKDYFTATEVAQMIRTLEGKLKHGVDGRDGRDGIDGKDGISPDARSVAIDAITILESFEGDAKLSALALKDLDEALSKLQSDGYEILLSEKQINTIKDLMPKYPPMNAGGSGATFLKSLRDVDLSGLTKNADGKYVLGGGSGSSTFLALTDTPATYTGQAGKVASVKGDESGLEFITPPGAGGGITRTVVVTSGNTSAGSTASVDYVYKVAGAHTVTLPTAVGNTNQYDIINLHSANNSIATTSSQTIHGSSAPITIVPNQALTLQSDGANWIIK